MTAESWDLFCLETHNHSDQLVLQNEEFPSLLNPGGRTKLTCSACCVDALKYWKEKEVSAYYLHSAGTSQLSTGMNQWFSAPMNFIRQDRQDSVQHTAYDKNADSVMLEGPPNMKFKERKGTENVKDALPNSTHNGKKCEKSEIGCKRNRRAKRQSITAHKMPLGACVQALREWKPIEVPFHKNRQG